jgi:hypothetical protein
MDEELKQLAALALRNAFWHDFSALTNKFLAAAEGLDVELQAMQMAELTSVFGRDVDADSDAFLNIYTCDGYSSSATTAHSTLAEALNYAPATKVYLCGEQVFEKRDGEWYFLGGGP